MKLNYEQIAHLYRQELFGKIIPFWQNYSLDKKYGGYFTCLDSSGKVYDTDKFIWLQARQVWTFAMLYNRCEKRTEWLDIAEHGAAFLRQYGHDKHGNWYFSLTRDGRPLVQPYNIFSDCFAAMAFGQLALANGNSKDKELALSTYKNILKRRKNPKGRYNKSVPSSRPMISMALPMILANLTIELEWLLEKTVIERSIKTCRKDLFGKFLDKKLNIMLEHVSAQGQFIDSFEGRLINPGHGIEAMAFMMNIAERQKDQELIRQAIEIILATIEYGWDSEYDGIFYFMDLKGFPTQQLEWDQKLWWVHLETLVSLAMAYRLSGDTACWQWYKKIHDYTWSHFPDPNGDEWYGYLNRRGELLLHLKGGKWKGCFHVPRAFYTCMRQFEQLSDNEN